MNEQLDLENILKTIRPESYVSIFSEESRYELIEYVLEIINDYVEENTNIIADPDFDEIIYEDISDIIYEQYENYLYPEYYFTYNDTVEDELNEIIDFAFELFYICFIPERSFDSNSSNSSKNKEDITKIITYLKSKPQPEQRTNEWYVFRHNLITASNAYKAFESDAMKNQLIYEKCQPIKHIGGSSETQQNQNKQVNINTPFHWGQKYEPVSVMIYEYINNTKVGDFGCIKHDKYSFLGASPDGINIDPDNEKYGVMLEIKNIVNREITGIPKKEYWVQTQLQMETCGLDECDFLETRFIEYENENAFLMDASNTTDDPATPDNKNIEKTAKDEYKGVIMYFANKEGNPFYVYKPMNIKTYTEFQKWEETEMERLESLGFNWIKNLYWRLDCLSCVLIKRNMKWFNENLHFLEELWKTVEYERVHGYEHRAPKANKKQTKNRVESTTSNKSICLIKINSDTGDVELDSNNLQHNSESISNDTTKTVVISSPNVNPYPYPNPTHKPNTLQFFKIRTQSFDESKHDTNITN